MAFRHIGSKPIAQVPPESSTCLLLINCQLGFRNIEAWGTGVSNPDFETHVKDLIESFRDAAMKNVPGQRPRIIHAQYRPVWTDHALHVSQTGPWGEDGSIKRGIDFLECATPRVRDPKDGVVKLYPSFDEPETPPENNDAAADQGDEEEPREAPPPLEMRDEFIVTSHGHSVFINTPLQHVLNQLKVRTLLIAGMSLDQYVSTAVRMAHNLALVGQIGGGGNMEDSDTRELWTDGTAILGKLSPDAEELSIDMMRIILVQDATRAFARGLQDPQVVHDVHVESLRDFAEIRTTAEIISALQSP